MRAFDALWAEAVPHIEAILGERVRIVPQIPAGLRGRPVAGAALRPPVEVIGRFRKKPVTSELEGNREGSKFQSMTRLAGNMLTLRISSVEAAKLGYEVVGSDVVVLLDRPGEPRFTIARAGVNDSGELMLELTAGGAA
nr:hypothetical protein NG677_17435 [Methylobacterium sp. OTU13CASTA1]